MCDYEKNQLPDTCDFEGTCLECVKFHIASGTLPTCLDLAGVREGRKLYYRIEIEVIKAPSQCPVKHGEKCGHVIGQKYTYPWPQGLCPHAMPSIDHIAKVNQYEGGFPIQFEGTNRRQRREGSLSTEVSCSDRGLAVFKITRIYIPECYDSDFE